MTAPGCAAIVPQGLGASYLEKDAGRMGSINWEDIEAEHLRTFFAHFQIDCVFDVGANQGQYRKMLRERVGFKGPIISFEPIPLLAAALIETRNTERDDGWHIETVALDRVAGDADFNVMACNPFSSLKNPDNSEIKLFSEMNSVENVIRVRKDLLSKFYRRYKSTLDFDRPFLKMDTQGSDIEVFDGAGDEIENFVGLQSELSIRKIYDNTLYYHEAISHYARRGFVLSALVPNTAGHFPDLVEIDCIMYRR